MHQLPIAHMCPNLPQLLCLSKNNELTLSQNTMVVMPPSKGIPNDLF